MRLVASSQGLFHFSLTWDSRLEAPPLYCFVRARVHAHTHTRTVSIVYVHIRSLDRLSTFPRSAPPCSQAPITAGLVPSPLSIGSDVACPTGSAPPLRPHICRVSVSAHGPRSAAILEKIVIMTSAHSRRQGDSSTLLPLDPAPFSFHD